MEMIILSPNKRLLRLFRAKGKVVSLARDRACGTFSNSADTTATWPRPKQMHASALSAGRRLRPAHIERKSNETIFILIDIPLDRLVEDHG